MAVRIVAARERAALGEDLLPDAVEGPVIEFRRAIEAVALGATGELHVVPVGGGVVGGAVGLHTQHLLGRLEGRTRAGGGFQLDGDRARERAVVSVLV